LRRGKLNKPKVTVSYVVLWIFIIACLIPLYVMIIGSLKPNTALFAIPPDLNPFELITKNYEYVFTKLKLFQWYGNSLFISGMIALLTVFVSSLAGYAFAKKRFAGQKVWFAILLATMMLPRQILLVPNFIVAKSLGLNDSLMGVVLTSLNVAFGVFLCKQFMSTLPNEMMEAAQIDGCGDFRTFIRIVFPLSMPVMGALAIFSFIAGWNDFLWQYVMLTEKSLRTMPIAIAFLSQEKIAYVGYQMAGAALCAIPMIIVFLIFQKYFIKGITVGAVKG
jgi:multiple sugar transport system permease protein